MLCVRRWKFVSRQELNRALDQFRMTFNIVSHVYFAFSLTWWNVLLQGNAAHSTSMRRIANHGNTRWSFGVNYFVISSGCVRHSDHGKKWIISFSGCMRLDTLHWKKIRINNTIHSDCCLRGTLLDLALTESIACCCYCGRSPNGLDQKHNWIVRKTFRSAIRTLSATLF